MTRPTVVLVVAASLDGKIASPFHVPLSSPADRRHVEERRAEADAVFLGAETVRVENAVSLIRSSDLLEARRRRGVASQPIQAMWSRRGDLSTNGRFFREPGIERVVFLGRSAPDDVVERLRALATVHRADTPDVDPAVVLRVLAEEHSVRRLVLECGGGSTAPFFRSDLIDEIHLTLAPRVLGGRASPTPMDGDPLPREAVPEFTLVELVRRGEDLFLVYSRRR